MAQLKDVDQLNSAYVITFNVIFNLFNHKDQYKFVTFCKKINLKGMMGKMSFNVLHKSGLFLFLFVFPIQLIINK